jgi:hypothetical protein
MDFFSALFDLSFSDFITTKLVRVLYVLLLVVIALALVFGVISGLVTMFSRGGFLAGLVTIVFAPIGAVIYTILARMWMEIIIVVFRIAENTTTIAKHLQSRE